MQRGLDGDSLKEILIRELLSDERPGDSLLRGGLVETRNPKKSRVGLKVISVVLAVLLWIYVGNQGEPVLARTL